MPTTQVNPYLDGNFASVRQEITTETLPVIGEIPPDLSGIFLRNGPNSQWSPIGQYHWFDGDGMLHGVRIYSGQASYQNRYVRTKGWQIEREAGKAIWSGLLEPPQMDNPYGPNKNAVFVPDPKGEYEDEGWLITFIHNSDAATSELVIVDAQNVTSEPLARVQIPQRLPYGFHGTWIGEAQLNI